MSANAIIFFVLFLLSLAFLGILLSVCNEKISLLKKQLSDNQQLIEKLKKDISQREQSIELKEFLSDLLSGDGLISISRVDPTNVFLYSPRDKK